MGFLAVIVVWFFGGFVLFDYVFGRLSVRPDTEGTPDSEGTDRPALGAIVVAPGILLIGMGVVILLLRLIGIQLPANSWPYLVLAPGILLLIYALYNGDQSGEVLAVISAVVIGAALILLYQTHTGHWESWTYAWTLVAFVFVGAVLQQPASFLTKRSRAIEQW